MTEKMIKMDIIKTIQDYNAKMYMNLDNISNYLEVFSDDISGELDRISEVFNSVSKQAQELNDIVQMEMSKG